MINKIYSADETIFFACEIANYHYACYAFVAYFILLYQIKIDNMMFFHFFIAKFILILFFPITPTNL